MGEDAEIQVAIAILSKGDRVLMQLRDDIPNIVYPGNWGFFGGHLEPDETPEQGVIREVLEEIFYAIPTAELTFFGEYGDRLYKGQDRTVCCYVFHAPLNVPLEKLQLNEGWDMALLSKNQVDEGGAYSQVAEQWRPMPSIHQRILQDFFDKA